MKATLVHVHVCMYTYTFARSIECHCVCTHHIHIELYMYYQGLIDSKEKRACNWVPIKLHSKAKNSNKFCTNYGIEAANVTKNSTVLQLV